MNFDSFKNMSVWELLKYLEYETKQNARKIKENSVIVIRLMNGQNKAEIDAYQKLNQRLVKQNADNVALHNRLLNFYKSEQKVNEPLAIDVSEVSVMKTIEEDIQYDFDEYLDKTISEEILFNSSHPFYCSETFKEKLLEHYIGIEAYEKCEHLVNIPCC